VPYAYFVGETVMSGYRYNFTPVDEIAPANGFVSASFQTPEIVPDRFGNPCTNVLFVSPKDVTSNVSLARSSVHVFSEMQTVATPVDDSIAR